MAREKILISEVGPRDGLQMAAGILPTALKKAWIEGGVAAGLTEIEVCSFVPPKLVPGMADASEVTRYAASRPGLTVAVLAPNLKGAMNAVAAGAHKITVPVSASRSHSLSNVRKTPEESVAEVAAIARYIADQPGPRPVLEGGLSTAFGCSIEGEVPEAQVLRLSEALIEAGADEVGLADTTGMGNPTQVKRLFKATEAAIGADKMAGAHFHNTRGQGLANVVAALDVGVRTFDSSLAGLGGCPFAPGASGNIVTEDLIWMLEEMGFDTGIDLAALLKCREILAQGLPDDPLYGHVPEVGLAKGGGVAKIAEVPA